MGKFSIPIVTDGYYFIFTALFFCFISFVYGFSYFSYFFLIVAGFFIIFFRDPQRIPPEGSESMILSPADGKVVFVGKAQSNRYLEGDWEKISIFMSVFNVHVNRIPITGKVSDIFYHKGRFFSANLDKSSEKNEQNAIILEHNGRWKVIFVQIAGLIARRIVCRLKRGDDVSRGARFGLIRFGSRVEVYLPMGSLLVVKEGEKVKAGKTVLGYLHG